MYYDSYKSSSNSTTQKQIPATNPTSTSSATSRITSINTNPSPTTILNQTLQNQQPYVQQTYVLQQPNLMINNATNSSSNLRQVPSRPKSASQTRPMSVSKSSQQLNYDNVSSNAPITGLKTSNAINSSSDNQSSSNGSQIKIQQQQNSDPNVKDSSTAHKQQQYNNSSSNIPVKVGLNISGLTSNTAASSSANVNYHSNPTTLPPAFTSNVTNNSSSNLQNTINNNINTPISLVPLASYTQVRPMSASAVRIRQVVQTNRRSSQQLDDNSITPDSGNLETENPNENDLTGNIASVNIYL